MSPSPADFSEILELQQYRRLYEEQEEKNAILLKEKDEEAERLRQSLTERDQQNQANAERLQQGAAEMERMRNDYQRLKVEAQQKIDRLMERIKDLNQRLGGK